MGNSATPATGSRRGPGARPGCRRGPWDAWIRAGQSVLPQPLPLTPGSDISGVVLDIGPGVSQLRSGDEVFGVTNARFTGGYAEYAIASATMLARKPAVLSFVQAASVPVVACTAWQMVFEHAHVDATKRVLIHGAAGNVGAYALQMAKRVAREVIATAFHGDVEYARPGCGSGDRRRHDTLRGGPDGPRRRVSIPSAAARRIVRSRVSSQGRPRVYRSQPDQQKAADRSLHALFFVVEVSSSRLEQIARLFEAGELATSVGDVLRLADFRAAHEMLAGKPHKRGKIVLTVEASGTNVPLRSAQ